MIREPWFGVEWSDAFLNDMADGCTDLTCPRHGRINTERRKRGLI